MWNVIVVLNISIFTQIRGYRFRTRKLILGISAKLHGSTLIGTIGTLDSIEFVLVDAMNQ